MCVVKLAVRALSKRNKRQIKVNDIKTDKPMRLIVKLHCVKRALKCLFVVE